MCIVEYDGTNFSGWQLQKNLRTVQGEIQKTLKKIYKDELYIIASGRTDAGVHSLGQVFNFKTKKHLNSKELLMGLNSLLPYDIAIKAVKDVDINFHSQISAKRKIYLYRICLSEIRSPLLMNRVWWVNRKIDASMFVSLLKVFEGEHNFSAMCRKKSIRTNSIRNIDFINVSVKHDVLISIELCANGFLHNMVRNIIGTAVNFSIKKKNAKDIIKILKNQNREDALKKAPSCGLYLKEVIY